MQLEVLQATRSFRGRIVFSDFDATFPGNAVTALVGPSGSGKSTLLAALAGIERLDSGHVRLCDRDGSTRVPTADQFAWISQHSNALPARTALDNVLIGPLSRGTDLTTARLLAAEALQAVGLEALTNRPLLDFSGGERQRVCFARAIASGRDFILADEPSSSLDAENTRRLARILESLQTRATIIVATHDPVMMSAAEIVISMRPERRA